VRFNPCRADGITVADPPLKSLLKNGHGGGIVRLQSSFLIPSDLIPRCWRQGSSFPFGTGIGVPHDFTKLENPSA
jgi:hypothetical protein